MTRTEGLARANARPKMRAAAISAILIFIALCAASAICLGAEGATPAFAAGATHIIAKTYDGQTSSVSPNSTNDGKWRKILADGKERVASDGRELLVRDASDSGTYRFGGETPEIGDETAEIEIKPRDCAFVWRAGDDESSAEYDDESEPFEYAGVSQGVRPFPRDPGSIADEGLSFAAVNNANADAGRYEASVNLDALPERIRANYAFSNATRSYEIKKRKLNIAVEAKTVEFGDELDPPGEGDVVAEGFVGKDDFSALINPRWITERAAGSDAGEYALSFEADSSNYGLIVSPATIAVLPRLVAARFDEGLTLEYGDSPTSAGVSLSNIPFGAPNFDVVFLDADGEAHPKPGTHEATIESRNRNYVFSLTPERPRYEIVPRRISLGISAAPTEYGDEPKFDVFLSSGSYAPGECAETLKIRYSPSLRTQTVGTIRMTAAIANENYSCVPVDFNLEVKPKLIEVTIDTEIGGAYGDPLISPSYRIRTPLPYGETEEDVAFVALKAPGTDAGEYRLSGRCDNPCYEPLIDAGVYIVKKRAISVGFVIPGKKIAYAGKPIKFDFVIPDDGFVGTDDEEIIVSYRRINESGTLDAPAPEISAPGSYQIFAQFAKDSKNYELVPLFPDETTVRIYDRDKTENGVLVRLESGWTEKVELVATESSASEFLRHETPTGLQRIESAYSITVKNSPDRAARISVPVKDDRVGHTIAAVKPDGSLAFIPCSTKNGTATFETSPSNVKFILWSDKDPLPYVASSIALLVAILIELSIFCALSSRLGRRKRRAYALLPLFFYRFPGGIYGYFALTVLESAIFIGLLAAILVAARKLTRPRR